MSKYELLKFIFTLFSLKLSKIIRKLGRESGNIMELKGIVTGIKLFTRLRRFGKTLTMSMLKYFFDVNNFEENRELFKSLYIEKSKYFEKQ